MLHKFLRNTASSLSVVLFFVMANVHVSTAADWPQFRGPNCSGISPSTSPLPERFSSTENVAWSVKLGDGVGSPVVAGGRVFVTAMDDERTFALVAYDANSGTMLWRRTWDSGQLPEVHRTNSHASTTPATDGERVYAYFSSLGMIAVDAASGDDVWQHRMPAPFFVFKWGPAMSPVLHNDTLIFCQDDDLYPAIHAFDKKTGKLLWKDERYDMAVNYSHPVIYEHEDGDEIVVAGTGLLVGYDLQTGKRLWFAKTLLRNIKTTPVVLDNKIYLSLQSSGIANQWLATADQAETGNNDGKLTKEEMQSWVGDLPIPEEFFRRTFDRGDTDGDGFLVGEELDAAFLHPNNFAGATFDVDDPADEYILAVEGGGRGNVTDSHVLWKHRTKHTDHIVSPFVHDGRMLLVKGGGITTVFETEEGTSLRRPKRLPNTGQYFASPIYGDGKIYIAGENGVVVVVEDGPEYRVLSKSDLEESIISTPAISDGRLLIRTREKLWCFTAPKDSTTSSSVEAEGQDPNQAQNQ